MRISDTLITIASLYAAAQAQECLAIDDGCANDTDSCCEGAWCNRWSMKCEPMDVAEEGQNDETCLAIGAGCANSPDGCCSDGWCNRWSMVCESVQKVENADTCLAKTKSCAKSPNDCCAGLRCRGWFKTCMNEDESSLKQLLEVF